jgi:predicted RNA-binding protein with PUA-like domain
MTVRRAWLMKTEPETFSIEDLERLGRTAWDGVRNYQARNYMQEMAVDDPVIIYHSNADPPGVAGLGRVVEPAHPDASAIDPASPYFDAASSVASPRWFCVDVGFVQRAPRFVPLAELRADPALTALPLVQRGTRLSVMPVEAPAFEHICRLAGLVL